MQLQNAIDPDLGLASCCTISHLRNKTLWDLPLLLKSNQRQGGVVEWEVPLLFVFFLEQHAPEGCVSIGTILVRTVNLLTVNVVERTSNKSLPVVINVVATIHRHSLSRPLWLLKIIFQRNQKAEENHSCCKPTDTQHSVREKLIKKIS